MSTALHQEALTAILVDALAEAQELLAHSDISSSETCCKVEGVLETYQDLLESGCAEIRLTGRAILMLPGEEEVTPSALDTLRQRWMP